MSIDHQLSVFVHCLHLLEFVQTNVKRQLRATIFIYFNNSFSRRHTQFQAPSIVIAIIGRCVYAIAV